MAVPHSPFRGDDVGAHRVSSVRRTEIRSGNTVGTVFQPDEGSPRVPPGSSLSMA